MRVLGSTFIALLALSVRFVHSNPSALRADAAGARVTIYADPFLDRFRARLRQAGERRVHIVFYGGSHVASDQYTGVVRDALARRFGDGGLGLFLPARPFSLYDHRSVHSLADAEGWSTRALHQNAAISSDHRFGRAGMAVRLRPETPITFALPQSTVGETVEIWYETEAATPASLECADEDGVLARTSTAGGFGTLTVPVSANALREQRLTLRAFGHPIKIFGVVSLRAHGVVVEAFGVPGARASDLLLWDSSSWSRQLQRMPPDLVVLGFGTNESGESRVTVEDEALALRAVLRRVQAAAPQVSCLVIGPSDRPRLRSGVWQARPRNVAIARAYREVAVDARCAFVDMMEFSGGAGSLDAWVHRGLALPDHVHFSDRGYHIFGDALARALIGGLTAS